ncbi:formate dehydrogenase accessory sulfurtransferase FdhD [Mucilaginibacter sp. UR6-11]|uniref:formate dehydrogenase accessory sulfurtransferase FdhD n=1 Tax=Mucilaginibacter sp. UR6-11 TaxID=1435644 RepID=UPI001E30FBE6|nr:formate dehydrogenase accessory sulfurtransferase FdhD [Mucilaginibacter sp. UR6-11]MCC8426277.1 formate dehydrogenase accessory sulfurtransferase FdhD [Mucilaginibacter sp. UR6-11]
MSSTTVKLPVIKVQDNFINDTADTLAIEEPLEIRLEYGLPDQREIQNISVTMRTPGNDAELAVGFLFTEGIIKNMAEVARAKHSFIACAENKENVIQISLTDGIIPELKNAGRNFYTTSGCGICGKGSIDAIRTVSQFPQSADEDVVDLELLYKLPGILSAHQKVFLTTGGLHACALFNLSGQLMIVREDVGRHNALDKLIGAALNANLLPLKQCVLLLSGRASFELVQKAAMAGINIIAAVGAPSSLAVQLAEEFNITLVGFLRGSRFNIYTAAHRITLPMYETSHQK